MMKFQRVNQFFLNLKAFVGIDKKKRHKNLNFFLLGFRNHVSVFDNFLSLFYFRFFIRFFKHLGKKKPKILFIGTGSFLNKRIYHFLRSNNFSYVGENSLFFVFLSQNLSFFKVRLSIFNRYKVLNENFLFSKENFIKSLESVFSHYEKPFVVVFLDVYLDNVFLRDFRKLNVPIVSFLGFNKGFNLSLVDYVIPLYLSFANFLKFLPFLGKGGAVYK
jgi:ribosomal protein S2